MWCEIKRYPLEVGVITMDFTGLFEGDHRAFNKKFFDWLAQAQDRLRASWNIDDASLCLVLIEIHFNEGLISEKEANSKQNKIFYRSGLKYTDLVECFYGRLLSTRNRNEWVKDFIIYDHLIQKCERTESVAIRYVYDQFKRLLPHLKQYKYELCHLCVYFNRPYRLPQSFWDHYKKSEKYTPSSILLKWLERKKYITAKGPKSLASYRNLVFDCHKLFRYRNFGSTRGIWKEKLIDLPCHADDYLLLIEHFKQNLLSYPWEVEIIEKFIILDSLLVLGEEWFLVDQHLYQDVFNEIKGHLLTAFRVEELQDYIKHFSRPYILFDA